MIENKYIGTWVDGIGSSEDLDSSGERIEQKGIDLSTVTQDGTITWEHKNDNSMQVVGKILEVKVISKKSDCDNERHEHFWEVIGKKPYLYVAGVLFDNFGHQGAQSAAAMLKFDTMTKRDKTKPVIGFSIEGSRLDKDGVWIKKCIMRKITLTNTPCNKACVAEFYEDPSKSKGMKLLKEDKESLLDIFNKSEEAGCELTKDEKKHYTQLYKPKGTTKSSTREYVPQPKGATQQRSGQNVLENKRSSLPKPKKVLDSSKITPKQDIEVGTKINYRQDKPKTGAQLYNDPDFWDAPDDKKFKKSKKSKLGKYDSNVRKALVASAGLGAPSSKVGTDILFNEKIDKKMQKVFKSEVDESWNNFKDKEILVDIVKSKYKNPNEEGIFEISKLIAYKMLKSQEEALDSLVKAKVDDVKHPEGTKLAATKKRQDRKVRNKDWKPNIKRKPVKHGDKELREMPYKKKSKTKEQRKKDVAASRAKRGEISLPSQKDLEYPMAASEKMEKDL